MQNVGSLTFVCCVESGSLESQTVRLVESIRRFGGCFSNAQIIAVTPRFGPPLSKFTRSAFDSHSVTYMRCANHDEYSWFNFLNKPLALMEAEGAITTDTIAFVDSDLLFVAEPSLLRLRPDEDFAAFPVEVKEMGTTGPGDPYETIWDAACKVAGLDLDSLPWVTTAQTNERVRLYFNGGLFVFRKSTRFAHEYYRLCHKLLDSRLATRAPHFALGFKEMVSIGFATQTLGLRWRALPYSHNYAMLSSMHKTWYRKETLLAAKIVHYHDSMWPPFWSTFITCLNQTHPEVGTWLSTLGPMHNVAPLPWRLLTKCLRKLRQIEASRYKAACTFY